MLESLDGFMIVFSSIGSIFYASESITSQLGYLPVRDASEEQVEIVSDFYTLPSARAVQYEHL